jgi:Protein of unknown function (DUF4446)
MLTDIAPYVALAAAVLAVVLLVFVLVAWSGLRRLRRSQSVVLGHHEQRDIVSAVEDLDSQVRNLREAVEILTDELDRQKEHLEHALTNRSIVRYDAFRDAGGEQSASFALLDSHRSGVVFSAIAARDFARIYVKHLDAGVADRDLSPEEQQAVEAAVPRPLKAGEAGPRAARAPSLAEQRPPFDDHAQHESPAPDDTAELTAEIEAGHEQPEQQPADTLSDATSGGGTEQAPLALLDDDAFTWVEPELSPDDSDEPEPPA